MPLIVSSSVAVRSPAGWRTHLRSRARRGGKLPPAGEYGGNAEAGRGSGLRGRTRAGSAACARRSGQGGRAAGVQVEVHARLLQGATRSPLRSSSHDVQDAQRRVADVGQRAAHHQRVADLHAAARSRAGTRRWRSRGCASRMYARRQAEGGEDVPVGGREAMDGGRQRQPSGGVDLPRLDRVARGVAEAVERGRPRPALAAPGRPTPTRRASAARRCSGVEPSPPAGARRWCTARPRWTRAACGRARAPSASTPITALCDVHEVARRAARGCSG